MLGQHAVNRVRSGLTDEPPALRTTPRMPMARHSRKISCAGNATYIKAHICQAEAFGLQDATQVHTVHKCGAHCRLSTAKESACVPYVKLHSLRMSYAKLFSTITESSLWSNTKEARLLFVSMLARADAVGFVEAALPGLARLSNLTLEETTSALEELMAPDPHSKSPEAEGRRIVAVERGWCLVNYEAYRLRRDEEERRDYMRKYMAEYRKRPVNSSKQSKPRLAKAEAEAEADKAAATPPSGESAAADQDFLSARPDTSPPLVPPDARTIRPRTVGDLQAVWPVLIVFRNDQERIQTILSLYGWDGCSNGLSSLEPVAKRRESGKQRVTVNELAEWLAKTYELDAEDYRRTGLPPPPIRGAPHAH